MNGQEGGGLVEVSKKKTCGTAQETKVIDDFLTILSYPASITRAPLDTSHVAEWATLAKYPASLSILVSEKSCTPPLLKKNTITYVH